MGRIGGQLDQLAQQLERQLGAQNRRVQEQAQTRGALGAGVPRRQQAEERPPAWAPSQSQQAEVHLNKRARLKAMLELAEDEEAGSEVGGEAGSEADGEAEEEEEEAEGQEDEQAGSEAAEEAEQAGEEDGREGAGAVANDSGSWSAELASEPSVLSHLSYSFSASEAAESPNISEQLEKEEEAQAGEDTGEEWALAPPHAAAEPQPALPSPAAACLPAEGDPPSQGWSC